MTPPRRPTLGHVTAEACAQVYAGAYGIAVAQGIAVEVAQGAARAAVEHFVQVMTDLRDAPR